MTIDERLDRLEHITAGVFEHWQKEREEDRALWRNTQKQIEETDRRLGNRIDQFAAASRAAAAESREADKKLGERIDKLGERIDGLVSAIGEWMHKHE